MSGVLPTSLDSQPVAAVLERLFKAAEETDPQIQERIRSESPGGVRDEALARKLLGSAYIPVSPEGGRLLYILARSSGGRNIVEFGTSFGISTIHLAAAARDAGNGRVISAEIHPEKIKQARRNLGDAGLDRYVELREGDALKTLARLEETVDLLFLDGWKELYLPVLKLVEPRLRTGSLVVADDILLFPEAMKPYLGYVRDPANGYTSVEFPVGDGMELSLRTA
jgi:predicted O-methyltransferase YrrM